MQKIIKIKEAIELAQKRHDRADELYWKFMLSREEEKLKANKSIKE